MLQLKVVFWFYTVTDLPSHTGRCKTTYLMIGFVPFLQLKKALLGTKRFAKWSCLPRVLRSRTNTLQFSMSEVRARFSLSALVVKHHCGGYIRRCSVLHHPHWISTHRKPQSCCLDRCLGKPTKATDYNTLMAPTSPHVYTCINKDDVTPWQHQSCDGQVAAKHHLPTSGAIVSL